MLRPRPRCITFELVCTQLRAVVNRPEMLYIYYIYKKKHTTKSTEGDS